MKNVNEKNTSEMILLDQHVEYANDNHDRIIDAACSFIESYNQNQPIFKMADNDALLLSTEEYGKKYFSNLILGDIDLALDMSLYLLSEDMWSLNESLHCKFLQDIDNILNHSNYNDDAKYHVLSFYINYIIDPTIHANSDVDKENLSKKYQGAYIKTPSKIAE